MRRTEWGELVSGVCRLTGNTGALGAGWRVGGTEQTEASQKETGTRVHGCMCTTRESARAEPES